VVREEGTRGRKKRKNRKKSREEENRDMQ